MRPLETLRMYVTNWHWWTPAVGEGEAGMGGHCKPPLNSVNNVLW